MTMHHLRKIVRSIAILACAGIPLVACDARQVAGPSDEALASPAQATARFFEFNHTYTIPLGPNWHIIYDVLSPQYGVEDTAPPAHRWECVQGPGTLYTDVFPRRFAPNPMGALLGYVSEDMGVRAWDNLIPSVPIEVESGVAETITLSPVWVEGFVDVHAYEVKNGALIRSASVGIIFFEFVRWEEERIPC